MSRFINTELKSDPDSDLEKIGARVDNKLEKSGYDSEQDILLIRFCLCLYFWGSNFSVKFVRVKNKQTFYIVDIIY